ncbi:hypothetical protein [Lacrimispora sp.]|uniref:hypothetical protein n=1 Tax=Lacrimispora sp. TaxID=2719234 RepID=UPI0034603683
MRYCHTDGTVFKNHLSKQVHAYKNASIIHVDIDPASISRNIVVDIPIVADIRNTPLTLFAWLKAIEQRVSGCKKQKKSGPH